MAQEDLAKLSKRAQRRITQEGEPVPEASTEAESTEKDEAAPEGAPAAQAEPPAEVSNRKARRTAAAKARAIRKRERAEASAIGLDASEIVDDALVRFTDKVGRWVRRRAGVLQWIFVVGVVAWLGYEVFAWRTRRVNARVSDELFQAIAADQGRVGDPEMEGKADERGITDPTRIFATADDRAKAAIEAYDEAIAERPGSAVATFAELGKGGVLLEMGRHDEALASYERALGSKPTQGEPLLRARALEGVALAKEAKGDLEGASKAFEEVAQIGGFELGGLYQRARLRHRLGDDQGAKDLLKQLFEKLGPPPASFPGQQATSQVDATLRARAAQLAAAVDPQQKDVRPPRPQMDAAAIQEMIRQMQQAPPTPEGQSGE